MFDCGRVPWLYQYWPGVFMVLWFYVQEHPKAQPAVVLVLKRLRSDRLGEAGNRTCDPWFNRQKKKLFVAFLGINQFHGVGLRFVCWFYYWNTQRLTESGFMEKPGIEPATPGLQDKGLSPTPQGFLDQKTTFS